MNTILFTSLILGLSALLSWPLGRYLKLAMQPAEDAGALRAFFEKVFIFAGGANAANPQSWKSYAKTLLYFNMAMFAACFAILALQEYLPLNPDAKGGLEPTLIFNTAASFVTNTNLQHYSGEVSMSYFSQIFGLMWMQFLSAATGISVLAALARGLSGNRQMGNFLTDVQRALFLVLLPLAFIAALLLICGGVPMTFEGAAKAETLEGAFQTIARGPVAAFVAIKQLGTNGGGFFGVNSAHPFENPNMFTNIVSMVSITVIPMACVWMYGLIIKKTRHAALIFGVMMLILICKIALAAHFESAPTAVFADLPVAHNVANLEGKELRFGGVSSPLWAVLTTSTSNGSVVAMHNSLNPLTGLVALVGMWLNATFGGVGVGMLNMFIYILISVFIAGLMVGRTPEYLGRKIESKEMKLTLIALISHPLFILICTAIFAACGWGISSVNDSGPRGFTEILYEFSSAAANNGSGYEGLADNTAAWNISTGIVMILGRFIPIILPLAIAGGIAAKAPTAEGLGTLKTEGATFGIMLCGVILFIGALTFFPAALLGPIGEHLAFMP